MYVSVKITYFWALIEQVKHVLKKPVTIQFPCCPPLSRSEQPGEKITYKKQRQVYTKWNPPFDRAGSQQAGAEQPGGTRQAEASGSGHQDAGDAHPDLCVDIMSSFSVTYVIMSDDSTYIDLYLDWYILRSKAWGSTTELCNTNISHLTANQTPLTEWSSLPLPSCQVNVIQHDMKTCLKSTLVN